MAFYENTLVARQDLAKDQLEILKEKYEEMMRSLSSIDLTKIIELEDNTELIGEAACAGGACEIT